MTKQDETLLTQSVQQEDEIQGLCQNRRDSLPIGYIPTPTIEYRAYRKAKKATVGAGPPVATSPIPIPLLSKGSRVLIWKQDPSVAEIGIRRAFLPGNIVAGPRDSRIAITDLPAVSANALGDFVQTPGTAAFD